jgi:predicted RNA-binding protein YlxR (DUF448 family)
MAAAAKAARSQSRPPAAKGRQQAGLRPKHIPRRMCIACREHDAKRGLFRIVRTPEGTVELDPSGRRNGRGAYLCHRPACWERALSGGALARSLNTTLTEDTIVVLRRHAAALPRADDDPEPSAEGSN